MFLFQIKHSMQPSRSSVATAAEKEKQDKKEKKAGTEQREETKMLAMSEGSIDSDLFVSKEKTKCGSEKEMCSKPLNGHGQFKLSLYFFTIAHLSKEK